MVNIRKKKKRTTSSKNQFTLRLPSFPPSLAKTRRAINFILLLGDCNAPHGVY